jgi:lysophospholipase L1-like esterase
MKTGLLIFFIGIMELQGFAQSAGKIDSSYDNIYYRERMDLFNGLPRQQKGIVFLGNSITERGTWQELLPGRNVINRGIGGDNTFGVLARLDGVLKDHPSVIFLLIGINDIGRGLPISVIADNYRRIADRVREESPNTKLYLQSVLPMNDAILAMDYLKNKKDSIIALNAAIKRIAVEKHLEYIDLHPVFADAKGDLRPDMTVDGIHLKPAAYIPWVAYLEIKRYL